MSTHAVVIVGAGPAGLMLAGELAIAGIEPLVFERRPSQQIAGSRAGGLHARTLEILDQCGIVERFLTEGQVAQVAAFGGTPLDISDFPSRHPYSLGLWQNHVERILASWVRELGVAIQYGTSVSSVSQDETGVTATLSNGRTVHAAYLVGCDGGRSGVRKQAGIDFPGWDATTSSIIAEVEMTEQPELGVRHTEAGINGIGRVEYRIEDGKVVYGETGTLRVMITEADVTARGEPTLEDLRTALIGVYGTDYGLHSPTWISRFTDTSRQAASYRDRRVLLAGDAAHVHSPIGGQGLNTGVQDAVNLGWKLARVVHGTSRDSLLDTYHAERHPVGARVLQNTMAQVALNRTDDRTKALRAIVAELVAMDEPRTRLAGEVSGLGIRYDLGDGHPLLGRRMPDLDLVVAGESMRMFALLRDAQPLLLRFADALPDVEPTITDHVRTIAADYDGEWQLPVLGAVAAPSAVLVRPDGYVAWVGDRTSVGLHEAVATWFGSP